MNTPCLFLSAVLFAPAQDDPTKSPRATEQAEPAPGNEARNRQTSTHNLRQLAVAFHNYHDAHGKMPADIVGKDGKPILSWRVLLLPYVEEDRLYKEFKLDEPWDSKHNRPLLETMPKVLQSPRVSLKARGYTVYQGFSGPTAVFRPGQPLRFAAVTDGMSNTILAIETTTAVPWSKPADIPFDPQKDLPDLGKALGQKPLAVLLDGSVRPLDLKKISAETLKNAINPSDGNAPGPDW